MNSAIGVYRRELLRWNERINLIGPEAREHIDEHLEEALVAGEILKPAGDVLDFGSGGGLPAIPMAIAAPDARFHLVEADRKKWAFLKHVVRECRLNAVIYGDRLARVVTRFPSELRFSLVTSRAVGTPSSWVPLLTPFLYEGSRVALFQGTEEVDLIEGFSPPATERLPRGSANYLVTLTFHVEQTR